MAVRINTIISPKDEMAELRDAIEQEIENRRSLRISADPTYYSGQKEYLEQQIAFFQAKLALLKDRFDGAEASIEDSKLRQKKLETRYGMLKHRDKIARIDKLRAEMQRLLEEIK